MGSFDMIYGTMPFVVTKETTPSYFKQQTMNNMFQIDFAKIEAKLMLDTYEQYQFYNKLFGGLKMNKTMITLSTGVEISEETVISALKKAGISVEPKHIWKAGDVAYRRGIQNLNNWRLIVRINGELLSINHCGAVRTNSKYFDIYDYKYAGRQSDLLEE